MLKNRGRRLACALIITGKPCLAPAPPATTFTRAGRKQLDKEARDWERTTAILARFLSGEHAS